MSDESGAVKMSVIKKVCTLAIVTFQVGSLSGVCDSSWNGVTSNWGDSGNWTPNCIPNANTDMANFNAAGLTTVNLLNSVAAPFSPTVNQLNFLTGASSYTISNPSGTAQITFAGTNVQFNVNAGTQTIDCPTALGANTLFDINGTVHYTGNSTIPSGSTFGITLEGTGTLNNDSTHFSPDAFVMNTGTINNSASGNMFSDGTSIVVINGGSIDNDDGNFANSAPSLIINGGNVTNDNGGEFAFGATSVIFNDGNITNTDGSDMASSCSTLVINGGTLLNDAGSTLGIGTTTIQINGGSITNNDAQFANTATIVEMNGGSVVNTLGQFANNISTFTMNGGFLSGSNSCQLVDSSNSFILNNGTVMLTGGSSTATPVISFLMTGGTFDISDGAGVGLNCLSFEISGGTFTNDGAGVAAGTTTFTISGDAVVNNFSNSIYPGGLAISVQTLTINGNAVVNNSIFPSLIGPANQLNISGQATVNNTSGATIDFTQGAISSPGTLVYLNNSTMGQNASVLDLEGGTVQVTNGSLFGQNMGNLNISGGLLSVDPTSTVGPTTMAMTGGTLVVDGTVIPIGTLPLSRPGVVTGSGRFMGETPSSTYTLLNGGTVIPGSPTSVGTLTLDPGLYVQTADGTLVINVASHIAGLLVAEAATLDGTLEVVPLPGFGTSGAKTFTIVSTTNGVTGVFSKLDLVNSSGLYFATVDYLPDSVLLNIDPALPSYTGNFYQMVFSSINQTNFLLFKHLDWVRENLLSDPENCCCQPHTLNVYAGGLGSVGSISSKGQHEGLHTYSAGGIVGIDYALTNASLGLEVDYQRLNGRGKGRFGKVDIDQLHFNLYGSYDPIRDVTFDLLIGGGHDWVHFHRATGVNNADVARGTPHANLFDTLAGVQYTLWSPSCFHLIPMASVQYISLNVKGYTERDAGVFNVSFDRQNFRSLRSLLGLRANWLFEGSCFSFIPEVNVAWQSEFCDQKRRLNVALPSNGTSSIVSVLGPGKNILLAGIDLQFLLTDCFGLEASYEFEGNTLFRDHFFYLGANAEF